MLTLKDLRVGDVMTADPVTFAETMSLGEAARLLFERNLSGAPVVGADGVLLSVLSTADVLRALAPAFDGEDVAGYAGRNVGELVRRSAVSCTEDCAVSEACKRMVKERVHRLVVVREGKPVGIITSMDAVRAIACLDDLVVDDVRG